MKRLLQSCLLQLLLLYLGVISLIWNLMAWVLYPVLSRSLGQRIGRLAISSVYRHFWCLATWSGLLRVDSQVLDSLRAERALIIAANHPSLLDALILVARLPHSACIMKASLLSNPFLGAGAKLARYICNDSARGMVRLSVNELRRGSQLVVFPEGTRTTQIPVNPFHPGVTLIAKMARAPIQTVFIDTNSPYLRKGWPIWKLPPIPIVFKVRMGPRFEPSKDPQVLLQTLERSFIKNLSSRDSGSGGS
jgi:1-acyl-sn-glycerol-3-phosphate acyltransferase